LGGSAQKQVPIPVCVCVCVQKLYRVCVYHNSKRNEKQHKNKNKIKIGKTCTQPEQRNTEKKFRTLADFCNCHL
jgi:hypothetical protein